MFDPKTKILIVDDMSTMRKLVMKACREIGFSDFTEAADGVQGWQTLSSSEQSFGLVISDWNMPNCTGLDFLKRVRADGRLKNTPFILVTAESEGAQVKEAIMAGVNNYVVKPFTTDSLRTKLEETHARVGK